MGVIRGSSYYTIVDGPTWNDAQAHSKALGGNLVSINDASENAWLINKFRFDYTSTGERFKWIGFISYIGDEENKTKPIHCCKGFSA